MQSQKPGLVAALAAFIAIGGIAIAQSANTGRVFPYVGYLEENGFPVDGLRDMRIDLYRASDAASPCYSLEFLNSNAAPNPVTVANGKFRVDVVDVPDNCLTNGELFATIAVGPVDGTLTQLATGEDNGRVRIGAVPFAAASPANATFFTPQSAEVGGDIDANGNVTAGISHLGHVGHNGWAGFSHTSRASPTGYALLQNSGGRTIVNSEAGQSLTFRIGNDVPTEMNFSGAGGLDFVGDLNLGRALRFDQDVGDQSNSATILYRPSFASLALAITGAGTNGSNRTVKIFDDLEIDETVSAGGSITAGGDVTASGTIRWNCPAGMTRIGTNCIDNTMKAATTYTGAWQVCQGEGKDLCSIETLMGCDVLQASTSECHAATDGNIAGATVFWTAGTAYDTFGSGDLFAHIACYNGDDNSVDRCDDGGNRRYFCCIPGVRGAP